MTLVFIKRSFNLFALFCATATICMKQSNVAAAKKALSMTPVPGGTSRFKNHGNLGGIIDLNGTAQCADCGEVKSNDHFTFYKNRIHPDTKLCLYANKKCTACRKTYAKHKKQSETEIREQNIARPKPTMESPYMCDCCGKPVYTSKYLQLDHCHKTGKFRGFTCKPCNISLGNLGDDVDGIFKAVKYLNKTEQKTKNEIQYMIDSVFSS